MEEKLRKQIINDYQRAHDIFSEILFKDRPNFWVKSEKYLSPTIVEVETPLDDLRGELKHYKRICDCLTEILIDEFALTRIPNAPDYVRWFF